MKSSEMVSAIKARCDALVESAPVLLDPNHVFGRCCEITDHLCTEHPDLQFTSLHVYGHRRRFPHRHSGYDEYENPDPNMYHNVALVKNKFAVDLTALQLNSKLEAAYTITPMWRFQKNWMILGGSWKVIEDFLDMRTAVRQSSRKWVQKAWCDSSQSRIAEIRRTNWDEATTYYLSLVEDMRSRNLVFTGTPANNPHLRFLTAVGRRIKL